MPLERLFQLIGELRDKAERHAVILRKNETRTRYALVDPLLTALGWDLADPDQVIPEFTVGTARRADYAMMRNDREPVPGLFVEAKALGTSISTGLSQSIGYCLEDGVQYFAVTDGMRWEVYDTHKPVPLADKKLLEFSFDDDTHNFALKALWLWRSNHVVSGPPATAEAPDLPGPATSPGPARTESKPEVPVDLPMLTSLQLAKLEDGDLVLCPSRPDGIEFLKTHNAWVNIRLNRSPRYLALYISQPVSAIQFLGEIDRIIDGDDPTSPLEIESELNQPGRKVVVLQEGRLWQLADPIGLGTPRPGKAPQGTRFLSLSQLVGARTMDDI